MILLPLSFVIVCFSCPSGYIEDVTHFGITPDGAKMLDACMPNEHTKMGDNAFDSTYVKESIISLGAGRQTCTIDVKSFITLSKDESDVCRNQLAQFYAQVSCKFNSDELKRRNIISIALVIQAVVTILLLLGYFHYTHARLKIKFKEWDDKTTTIEDFTIKCEIPQALFDNFILIVYKQSPNENPVYAFKMYLRDHILRMINTGNTASDAVVSSNIVDIEFTFSNILLLELMQKRAHAIEDNEDEKRINIEKEIINEYSSKNKFR